MRRFLPFAGADVLAALDEPSDIRVLARGLLVADRDGKPVFREVDLPGERCVECPAELPGPNGKGEGCVANASGALRRPRPADHHDGRLVLKDPPGPANPAAPRPPRAASFREEVLPAGARRAST